MALRTPLYERHRDAGARFVEFGGWDMPLQYTGIIEEHLAVRQAAGLFDVSHMGKLFLEGASAYETLDYLSVSAIPREPGQARYTHLLREDGAIVDDVIVTCLAKDRFFLVCNAGPRATVLRWLLTHRREGTEVRDGTQEFLCLALQGPRAPELLGRLTPTEIGHWRPFQGRVIPFGAPPELRPRDPPAPPETKGWGSVPTGGASLAGLGTPRNPPASTGTLSLFATRTGYTGEAGFELFPRAALGPWAWDALLAEGRDVGLRPIGLGARDTLRLEKGYLLAGQDFDGHQTPLEVHCERIVAWNREFLGKRALEAQRTRGVARRLVGLRMGDRGIPRPGCAVLDGGRRVGRVTSGTLSPSLRVGIALASVEPSHASTGTSLQVEIRGVLHSSHIVPLPFL